MKTFWKTIKGKKEDYSVRLMIDKEKIELFSCTCIYGSFYRFSKKNKNGKEVCRHVVKAYAEVINVSPTKAREILIKQKIINKQHIKKI